MSVQQTVHHALTGATVGGGVMGWLTVNSSAVTVIVVMITGVASIGIGLWNARSSSEANRINEEANRVSRREMTNEIISSLEKDGKSSEYIADLIRTMRK